MLALPNFDAITPEIILRRLAHPELYCCTIIDFLDAGNFIILYLYVNFTSRELVGE